MTDGSYRKLKYQIILCIYTYMYSLNRDICRDENALKRPEAIPV